MDTNGHQFPEKEVTTDGTDKTGSDCVRDEANAGRSIKTGELFLTCGDDALRRFDCAPGILFAHPTHAAVIADLAQVH